MLIACLGWGSLVWDPRTLPTGGPWFGDGPFLPIELARQSSDGRITLVLVPGKPLVRSLWTLLSVPTLREAMEALGQRERIRGPKRLEHVGAWARGEGASNEEAERIATWATALGLDAVVWTALPPRFAGESRAPTVWEVVTYLDGLQADTRSRAEEYVRRTPRQIDTECRRYIEQKLGWTPLDEGCHPA